MRLRTLLLAGLLVAVPAFAQSPADSPATREDILRYLEVMHSRQMMQSVMDAMSKQMHEATHKMIEANLGKVPPDFEASMNRMMDDMMKEIPIDEMFNAMIPVYQKHFTKGDVDALLAFYATPTGQKVIRDLPAIMADAMEAYMPIIQTRMVKMQERLQAEVAAMIKQSSEKPKDEHP